MSDDEGSPCLSLCFMTGSVLQPDWRPTAAALRRHVQRFIRAGGRILILATDDLHHLLYRPQWDLFDQKLNGILPKRLQVDPAAGIDQSSDR